MKFQERAGDSLVFRLGAREKPVVERLLAFYPLRPNTGPTLSRSGGPELAEADALLAESLREQRDELAAWVSRRLASGEAFRKAGAGWHLELSPTEIDHLLQVLNDLRVGAWTRLGCPEDLGEDPASLRPEQAPLQMIMNLAGHLEIVLLHALIDEPRPPDS